MQIIIDIEDETPLFAQLVKQIKTAIMAKKPMAGDALPSIRQLATDLDINKKTVAKAYQMLERDNVIVTKGYRGTFVHPDAIKNCNFNLNEWIIIQLTQNIKTLRDAGATDSEMRIAFAHVMNETK
ncbi:MAG: GntR family transcriptional regulator [Rhizobiales bacterium]|nr:GntR family transcriptional regulator [Hyphomicrobiales bacterium]NRB14630.1 GntR family transcriptional regulator [Hyphomicrobiales bacterium]